MSQIIILQLDSNQLKALIREAIAEIRPVSQEDQIMTVKEAAKYLKVSDGCIYGRIADRDIAFSKKGKRIYFKKSDLDKWIAGGAKATKEEILTLE